MKLTKALFGMVTGIDHFYVGFTKQEINDLKRLRRVPWCFFSKIVSGKRSWQGVYWHSTSQSYFEMIECETPGQYSVGVALSAISLQYRDIRSVKELYEGSKSLTSTIMKFENGRKWFESISKKTKIPSLIHVWGMHYFFTSRPLKHVKRVSPSLIERFKELEIAANPKFLKDLKETCYWVPYKMEKKGNVVMLEFLNKDRSPFRIKCNIDESIEHVNFVSLTAQASPFRKNLPELKYFDLSYTKDQIVLKRKKLAK